jgi:hypothetical protein
VGARRKPRQRTAPLRVGGRAARSRTDRPGWAGTGAHGASNAGSALVLLGKRARSALDGLLVLQSPTRRWTVAAPTSAISLGVAAPVDV